MKGFLQFKLIIVVVCLLSLQNMQAQNTWVGNNAIGEFIFCDNWTGSLCPSTWNSTTDLQFNSKNNGLQTTMYVNFGAWRDVKDINYMATYAAGLPLDCDGNGLNFYGRIQNYSTNFTQTFNTPFSGQNATQIELNPINGGMIFNNPIFNPGNKPFLVYGPNFKKLTLNSYPEGNNTVTFSIKQASIVEVNYSNAASLSGGYFVEEGELWVESSGVIQGGIQVGNGNALVNKLYISNPTIPTTVANNIGVPAFSTNATIGSLNTSGTHTYSGTVLMNNSTVNFDVFNAGATLNFTNFIAGTNGGLRKIGLGLMRLSATNFYTGTTTINQGTLQYGVANAIANTSNVVLNGGKFSTGATTGFTDTVGTLALTADSTIELGTGFHTLTFAASNAVPWTALKTLTINGWTSNSTCTAGRIFVGNSNTGLTATQLLQITFQGYLPGANITAAGELIPGNITLTATAGTLLGNYATLKGAFDAINLATHTGTIAISVLNDTNEGTATAQLNQVAGVTSVSIQPGGCGAKIITGNTTAGNPLVDLNGADNVNINGLNISGHTLTFSNTTVSNTPQTCTIRFQTDATNNTINSCTILGSSTMASGGAGGNIFFGANSTLTGNDNNTVSFCDIGPAGLNLPSKGITFTGTATPGLDNSNILINNNNIYDYFSSTVASAGVDVGFLGTNTVSITNNRFYQTGARTLNAAVIHSAIRVANSSIANGNGFTITGNTIGYANSGATGTYTFTSTVNNAVFNPINLTLANLATNSVQNNTIAGISHTSSNPGFTINPLFSGINVTSGNVNIGNVAANTIGLAAAPITFTATGAGLGGIIYGINMTGAGNVAIQNNVIQAITTGGVAASAFNVGGINVAGAAVYTINNNTIGNAVAADSFSLGAGQTAINTFTGIGSAVIAPGTVTIGAVGVGNIIQNIVFYSTASSSFTGISNTGANSATNINYNVIKLIRYNASGNSPATGISNSGAVNGPINITNNNCGAVGFNFVTNAVATVAAATVRGIVNSNGGAAGNLSITSNIVRNISHVFAGVSPHTYISNSGNCPSGVSITLNTVTGLSLTGGIVMGIDDSSTSASKTIANNTITSLANIGAAVTAINSSNGTTVGVNTNTISSISSTSTTGTSIVSGINVTGGTTISITSNPISTLSSANDGNFVGIAVNSAAATTVGVTGNTISGMTSSSTGTLANIHAIEVGGSTSANINSNTISNINTATTCSTSATIGIYVGASGSASTINSNTISGINATTTANVNVSIGAISTGGTGATGTISKNRIYGLTNSSTGATNYVVGFIPGGGNWTFANNMISLINSNTVQTVGILDPGAAGARKYFYNSVYIGGAHAGSQVSNAFQFNSASGTADIKNNIFVMARTSGGKNYAIANGGGSFSGMTTDYNVLNCTVPATVGFGTGADQTFATWKSASGGDANSYSAILVPFANTATADLHIATGCSDIESGGTPVTVTDDYDAGARNVSTPDIGADEYSGTRPADVTLTPNTPLCGGSSTTLTASSTDLTYVYTWSPGTGLSATTGASVTATPSVATTYTLTATSPSSCVKIKDVTVTVNPTPAPITVTPSTTNMCANTIQILTASPTFATAVVGTANANVATVNNTPYRQASSTLLRIQYLMTKAELNAVGFYGGNITALAFNVTAAGTGTMPTYDISLAQTTDTALTATYINAGLTTVYNGVNILPVVGLNTYTFPSAFTWNGTSNIVVNICHTATGIGTNPFSKVTLCTPTAISTNSKTNVGTCSVVSGTVDLDRPVITLTYNNPITWAPTTDLYIDAAATTAYNPALPAHSNLATIYTKPSIPRVYTASATSPTTGCAATSTGTITMTSSVWNGSSWTPPATGNTSLSFSADYTSLGNLSGCSCSITGNNVIFNGPHAMILTNGLSVAAPGTIKFNNGASLVQTNDAAVNTGIITMERITPAIYRYDYTYWGTPVTLASNFSLGSTGGLSPDTLFDKFFSWTPSISNGMGNWINESPSAFMNPIKGYIARAPQTYSPLSTTKIPYTANFVGTPNNGVISCPIYHGNLIAPDETDDWNLLGNPYPSAVSAALFLGDTTNATVIDGTIYFWTHNSVISTANPNPFYGTFASNYNNNDYASWNKVGPVATAAGTGGPAPSGFIAAGQGFFTKSRGSGVAPASGTNVTFNNSMRVAGSNTQFFRTTLPQNTAHENDVSDLERHRIWLDLINNGGAFNQILIGYVEGATLGLDRDFDGVRFTDETSSTFYSVVETSKLVIQGRPLPFNETDEVPLGYRSAVPDTFTFGLDHVDELFENQNIYIQDRDLNITHDLKLSPYTFASEAGTFNNRFVLRYLDSALGVDTFNTNPSVTAFISNHELNIKSSKNITHIDLYDIAGKLIQQYTNENDSVFRTKFYFAQGVYLAKIKLDDGSEAIRKVVH